MTIWEEITIDNTIEIGKIIEEMTPDKDTVTGVKVGIDQELIVVTVLEVEEEVEARNRDRWVQPRSRTLSDDRERSNSGMSTNRD